MGKEHLFTANSEAPASTDGEALDPAPTPVNFSINVPFISSDGRRQLEEQIEQLRLGGKTNPEIRESLSVKRGTLQNIVRKLIREGRIRPQRIRRTKEGVENFDRQVEELRKQKLTAKAISLQLNTEIYQVRNAIHRLILTGKTENWAIMKEEEADQDTVKKARKIKGGVDRMSKAEAQEFDQRLQILLRENPQKLTYREISQELGVKTSKIQAAFRRLRKKAIEVK